MRRQMFLQDLEKSRHYPLHLYLMRILATFCISLVGSSYAITCHCLNNSLCNQANGSCPNGCELGWHGPGCQIGNVAFRKPASQSTTYNHYAADKAVDGVTPQQGDYSERNCSHTLPTDSSVPNWWFVSLSESEDFVIINITIVNRQGPGGFHLNNFYILYTSETVGHPNLTTWKHCTHQRMVQSSTIATYTCNNGTAIGRRVAVYLAITPESAEDRVLTLCEVIVNGYAYQETSMFRHTTVAFESGCNSSTVQLATLPVVPPTFLVVHINSSNGIHGSRMERLRNVGARFVTIFLTTMANATYNISVAPETCCIGQMCLNSDAASIERSRCVIGSSTFLLSIDTPQYQKYGLQNFGNVVGLTMLGFSQCRLTNFQIHCKGADSADGLSQCSTVSCTLDPRQNLTCTLQVIYSDGFAYTTTSNFTMEALPDTARNEQNASYTALDLAAAAGGSSTAVLLIAALTLAVILRHRKKRRTSDKTGVVDKFTASSFARGNYQERSVEESTYASLNQESRLQDEHDYSELHNMARDLSYKS